MHSTILKGKEGLANYPEADVEVDTDTLSVYPSEPGGFTVSLTAWDEVPRWTVSFDAWHEDFEVEQEALDCFGFGLSPACRLRIDQKGRTDYRWTVEQLRDGQWIGISSTLLFRFPFWRRRRTSYFQNSLLRKE